MTTSFIKNPTTTTTNEQTHSIKFWKESNEAKCEYGQKNPFLRTEVWRILVKHTQLKKNRRPRAMPSTLVLKEQENILHAIQKHLQKHWSKNMITCPIKFIDVLQSKLIRLSGLIFS